MIQVVLSNKHNTFLFYIMPKKLINNYNFDRMVISYKISPINVISKYLKKSIGQLLGMEK